MNIKKQFIKIFHHKTQFSQCHGISNNVKKRILNIFAYLKLFIFLNHLWKQCFPQDIMHFPCHYRYHQWTNSMAHLKNKAKIPKKKNRQQHQSLQQQSQQLSRNQKRKIYKLCSSEFKWFPASKSGIPPTAPSSFSAAEGGTWGSTTGSRCCAIIDDTMGFPLESSSMTGSAVASAKFVTLLDLTHWKSTWRLLASSFSHDMWMNGRWT